LSALDARLRQAMQLELKRVQREVGTTFIFVTHDQAEALAMSDRIALIHRGRVEQIGTAEEIYRRPATAFAAEFVGEANLLEAELVAMEPGGARMRVKGGLALRIPAGAWPAGSSRALVSIRPEKILVSSSALAEENAFEARVDEKIFKGALDQFVLTTTSGARLVVIAASETAHRKSVEAGDRVWCAVHADDVVVVKT
jgi:spermidine/putrescine transport system ATP-binding protein